MDSAKLNDWMQVVGIFSVVASLIFVGMQMQLDRDIARVTIYQSRASTVAELYITAASSPEANAAAAKSRFGDPNTEIRLDGWSAAVTAQDMVLGTFQVNAFLTVADNSFFQYQEGFLPEGHWQSVKASLVGYATAFPFAKTQIEALLQQQRPAFREELVDVIAAAESASSE